MFLLKRSGGMSQNNVVLMHHFIQSTAPPYKNGLIQKFEGCELKSMGLFPSPYTATEPTGSVAVYGYITETAHIVRSPYTATEPILCEMVR